MRWAHRRCYWWLSLLTITATTAAVDARLIRAWSAADLWKEADLVVVATVKTSTRDDLQSKLANPNPPLWVPVRTTFDVLAVAQGKLESKTLTLRHFRLKNPRQIPPNAPGFVHFNSTQRSEYLLFLKRSGDHWEALTGQWDPEYAVKELRHYQSGPPPGDRDP